MLNCDLCEVYEGLNCDVLNCDLCDIYDGHDCAVLNCDLCEVYDGYDLYSANPVIQTYHNRQFLLTHHVNHPNHINHSSRLYSIT